MARTKLTAYRTAQALVVNAQLSAIEKDKDFTRFRFSRQMLRSISGWKRLSEPFIHEVFDELYGLGWTAMELSDTELAAIKSAKISVWPKLSGKKVLELATREVSYATAIQVEFERLFGADEDDYDDE